MAAKSRTTPSRRRADPGWLLIDIVGADREPVARQPLSLGSVKWLETAQFDDHDLVELQRHRDRVTSEPVPLIAVSRAGTASNRIDAPFSPEDLLKAW
jgi:hypothetical protein